MTETREDPTVSTTHSDEDRSPAASEAQLEKLVNSGIGSEVKTPDITVPKRFTEPADSAGSRNPRGDESDDGEVGGRERIHRRSSLRDSEETSRRRKDNGRQTTDRRFGTTSSRSHGGYGADGFRSAEEPTHVAPPSGTTLSDAPAHASARKEESVNQQRTDDRPEMNTCPVCGKLKLVGRTDDRRTQEDGTEPKFILYLVCRPCSDTYSRYRDAAVRMMAQDDSAPEPMDKFRWVFGEIDLNRFEQERVDAKAAYRSLYEEAVITRLERRGYVESVEWNENGRPYVRFEREHFEIARALELNLRGEEGVKSAFLRMVRTQKRLEVAPQLLEELGARFAASDSEASGGNPDEAPTELEPVAVGATTSDSPEPEGDTTPNQESSS